MRTGPWSAGRLRCAFRKGRERRSKINYRDADDAWTGAFLLFADTGRIATPYRCSRTLLVVSRVIYRYCGNPWSAHGYDAYVAKDQWVFNGCSEWHITTRAHFMLPRSGRVV